MSDKSMKRAIKIPDGICSEAREYMRELIELMEKQNILTSLDESTVELIGYTYHNFITAQKTILKEGQTITSPRGEIKAHPCVKIALDSQIQLDKLTSSFGMNPKARKEIAKSETSKKKSPIEEFIDKQKEVR
jgi:P27 family predicted phage terminase small subunit